MRPAFEIERNALDDLLKYYPERSKIFTSEVSAWGDDEIIKKSNSKNLGQMDPDKNSKLSLFESYSKIIPMKRSQAIQSEYTLNCHKSITNRSIKTKGSEKLPFCDFNKNCKIMQNTIDFSTTQKFHDRFKVRLKTKMDYKTRMPLITTANSAIRNVSKLNKKNLYKMARINMSPINCPKNNMEAQLKNSKKIKQCKIMNHEYTIELIELNNKCSKKMMFKINSSKNCISNYFKELSETRNSKLKNLFTFNKF